MLPKKRLEKDAEEGNFDTLIEGKPALQSFKQTISVHLGKHVERELALIASENAAAADSCDSESSLGHLKKGLPTKRRKTE